MVASYLGTTVEFYDFLLYGTAAALVFPHVFFEGLSYELGVILSYVTLAAGYVARPIGGLLFGHFGDRYGRKRVLLITMLIMGLVSIGIGVLPPTQAIGVAAPIALVTLRVIQGIAVGGEWAGAALIALEHAQPKRRGFAASIAVSGGPSGAVLATVVFGIFSALPPEEFLAWGWRIPFLLSVVIVLIALYLRSRVTESPDFAKAAPATRQAVPILTVLRRYPGRVLSSIIAGMAPLFIQSILATFVITYAVSQGHHQATALWMVTIANFIMIFTIPAFAALSDRLGRRRVIIAGYAFAAATIWLLFFLIEQQNTVLLLIAFIIGNPLAMAFMYGPMGAYFSEKFDPTTRYTGVSLSYQLSTVAGAGFAPLIASTLLGIGGGSTSLVSLYVVLLCAIGAVAVFVGKQSPPSPVEAPTTRSSGRRSS